MSEIDFALKQYLLAVKALEEGLAKAKDDLGKDGVIQRFEFTSELLWKTLKVMLGFEGYSAKTPRQCLQEGFRVGMLPDDKIFLDILEDRNRSSHLYNKKASEEIFLKIKKKYSKSLAAAGKEFQAYYNQNYKDKD